jgi:hypothetical protein
MIVALTTRESAERSSEFLGTAPLVRVDVPVLYLKTVREKAPQVSMGLTCVQRLRINSSFLQKICTKSPQLGYPMRVRGRASPVLSVKGNPRHGPSSFTQRQVASLLS